MNAFTVSYSDGVAVGISGGKSGIMLGCAGEARQILYASDNIPCLTKMVGCPRTIRTAHVVQVGDRADFNTVYLAKDQPGLKPNDSDPRALVHAWFIDHNYHVDDSNNYPNRYKSTATLLLAHRPRHTARTNIRYDVLAVLAAAEWFEFSHNGQLCYVTCEPPTEAGGHTHVRLLNPTDFAANPAYRETASLRNATRVI